MKALLSLLLLDRKRLSKAGMGFDVEPRSGVEPETSSFAYTTSYYSHEVG